MTKLCSLVLLSTIFASCLVCAAPTTEAPSLEDKTDLQGESRTSGGYIVTSVPPFLGSLWSDQKSVGSMDYGRFVGHAIRIGPDHIIAHDDSNTLIKSNYDGKVLPDPKSEIEFDISHTLDLNHGRGYSKGHILAPSGPELGKLNGTYIRVYHYGRKGGQHDPVALIERNKTEMGSNCWAYGWSKTGRQHYRAADVHQLVKYPVLPVKGSCVGARCTLKALGPLACDDHIDNGQPVLCGPQEKLTYIVEKQKDGEICSNSIQAYHIPQLVEQIDANLKHVKIY